MNLKKLKKGLAALKLSGIMIVSVYFFETHFYSKHLRFFSVHVANCTDLHQSDFLEALRQETKILEKRVIACKSHVMMVTVFDAVPPKKIV